MVKEFVHLHTKRIQAFKSGDFESESDKGMRL